MFAQLCKVPKLSKQILQKPLPSTDWEFAPEYAKWPKSHVLVLDIHPNYSLPPKTETRRCKEFRMVWPRWPKFSWVGAAQSRQRNVFVDGPHILFSCATTPGAIPISLDCAQLPSVFAEFLVAAQPGKFLDARERILLGALLYSPTPNSNAPSDTHSSEIFVENTGPMVD